MQMQNGTTLFVVGSDGLTKMTFGGLSDALKGGTKMQDIEVFTDRKEAERVDRARKRRQQVSQFTDEEMLKAAKMVLVDADGEVIHMLPFCPTV